MLVVLGNRSINESTIVAEGASVEPLCLHKWYSRYSNKFVGGAVDSD